MFKPTQNSYREGNSKKSDYLITNRRKNEDARNTMLETTAYYAKTGLQSQFEETTNLAIRRKKLQARLEELKNKETLKLEERQNRLKELFKNDNDKFRQELMAKESTTDSRVDAMKARVAELKAKREAGRQKIVEEKLLQQWRQQCDELRQANSMILDKEVALSRSSQLLEKEAQKAAAAKERQYYDILWEQDRQKKIQREEQDRLHRYELNQNMIKTLGEQLAMLKAQAAEEKLLKQEEANMMAETFRYLEEEEERERIAQYEGQRQTMLELDLTNADIREKRQKEADEAFALDLNIINECLKQDELERKAKSAEREALKKEMQAYRDHLLAQKEIEKEREKEIEAKYKVEDEKLWTKRSERWKKEQKARDTLMREVLNQRQEQVKYRLEQNRLAQENIRLEKEKVEADIKLMISEDEKAWEIHQNAAKRYCDDLFAQIQNARQRKIDEIGRNKAEDEAHRQLSIRYDHILEEEMNKLKTL